MNEEIAIMPLQPRDVEAAKSVIVAGCKEFFGTDPADFEDMNDLSQYSPPKGMFLVLTHQGSVVGTGAIRGIAEDTCELKRMWFLPEYRGKGYGMRMADMLLNFAFAVGYRRVLLDTDPRQVAAQRLYEKLGFERIERYNDGPCSIFMAKRLVHEPGSVGQDAGRAG